MSAFLEISGLAAPKNETTKGPVEITESLLNKLRDQVEFYFLPHNLGRDRFLTSSMDQAYFAPLEVVAEFNKVKTILGGINVTAIRSAVETSSKLELNGAKSGVRPVVVKGDHILIRARDATLDAVMAAFTGAPSAPSKVFHSIAQSGFLAGFDSSAITKDVYDWLIAKESLKVGNAILDSTQVTISERPTESQIFGDNARPNSMAGSAFQVPSPMFPTATMSPEMMSTLMSQMQMMTTPQVVPANRKKAAQNGNKGNKDAKSKAAKDGKQKKGKDGKKENSKDNKQQKKGKDGKKDNNGKGKKGSSNTEEQQPASLGSAAFPPLGGEVRAERKAHKGPVKRYSKNQMGQILHKMNTNKSLTCSVEQKDGSSTAVLAVPRTSLSTAKKTNLRLGTLDAATPMADWASRVCRAGVLDSASPKKKAKKTKAEKKAPSAETADTEEKVEEKKVASKKKAAPKKKVEKKETKAEEGAIPAATVAKATSGPTWASVISKEE